MKGDKPNLYFHSHNFLREWLKKKKHYKGHVTWLVHGCEPADLLILASMPNAAQPNT